MSVHRHAPGTNVRVWLYRATMAFMHSGVVWEPNLAFALPVRLDFGSRITLAHARRLLREQALPSHSHHVLQMTRFAPVLGSSYMARSS